VKPAQWNVSGRARALAYVMALVLALGAVVPVPRATAAEFAKGDHLIVVKAATWHKEPGQSANFSVPAGDDVYVLDGPQDGEYLVAWGSDQGWLDASDLAPFDGQSSGQSGSQATPAASSDQSSASSQALTADELTGSSVVVAHTANGVNLRAQPAHDAKIVDKLPEGTVVQLRIDQVDTVLDPDGVTRWWPVSYNGEDGWIAGFYLAPAGNDVASNNTSNSGNASGNATSSAASGTPTASSTGLTADQITGNSVQVANSANGVNLRANPTADAKIVDKLSEGTVVTLRIDQTDTVVANGIHWWPVSYNGEVGWIDGAYLAPAASSTSSTSGNTTGNASTSVSAKFSAGDYAAAKTPSGKGVRIRADAAPDAAQVGSIDEGDVVQVMSGPVTDSAGNTWYKVTTGDVTGYADGDLLVPAPQPSPPPSQTSSSTASSPSKNSQTSTQEAAKFSAGDYAAAKTASGTGVNIRADATMSASVVGYVAEGAIVQIEDGPVYDSAGTGWYKVTNNGVTGYVDGDLFVASEAPAASSQSSSSSSSASTSSSSAASSSSSSTAQSPTVSSSGFIYPLSSYTLTQGYGCTGITIEPWDAALGCYFHDGIDLAAPSYTPIMAAASGTVVAAGWCDCGLGYMVEIDHGNGFQTEYGHMAEQPYVSVGQYVTQGETIGPVGSTGDSTGPHVHFMILLNGNTVDPLDYLP